MFDYEVLTEAEALAARYQLMKDGEYDAVINDVIDKVSHAGNHMFEVHLDVYDEAGKPHQIRDYWVFQTNMIWKIIHGCKSAGILEVYENKTLTPALLRGRSVRVKIITQVGNEIPIDKLNGKPLGSRYPDKNSVDDYLPRAAGEIVKPKAQGEKFEDDDLPF